MYAEAETSVGGADETATGSLNLLRKKSGPRERPELRANTPEATQCHPRRVVRGRITLRSSQFGMGETKRSQIARTAFRGLLTGRRGALDSLLQRARDASRSSPLREAVGGSRKSVGVADESAPGSLNLWRKKSGPRERPGLRAKHP